MSALSILREAERDDAALAGCSLLDGLEAYQALLDDKSYLDYSSILDEAVALLTTNDGLRERLAERVKYVIVDEYQDVNPVQEAIVWSLHDLGAQHLRGRRRRPDDLPVARQRRPKHSHSSTSATPTSSRSRWRRTSARATASWRRRAPSSSRTRRGSPKAMKPTGAQAYEPGDIVALSFADPEDEARHIAETIQALRGVAFREDGSERGLSWSDMAVLLRSVKANGEPITERSQAAGSPVRRHRHDQSLRHGGGRGGSRSSSTSSRDRPGRGRERAPEQPGRPPALGLDPSGAAVRRSRAPRPRRSR